MRYWKRATWITLLGIMLFVLLFGGRLVEGYIDWLWFGEVRQRGVFWTIFRAQLELGLLFGIGMALLMFVNVTLARRTAPTYLPRYEDFPLRVQINDMAQRGMRWFVIGGSLGAGLLSGMAATTSWEPYLRFRHPQSFGGAPDPIFRNDIGFYMFRLPFLEQIHGWLFMALFVVVLVTTALYYMQRSIEAVRGELRVSPPARVHLSTLLGCLALVIAWGFFLNRYELLFSQSDKLVGAAYTDVHARLPAANMLAIVAVIAAVGFFANAWLRVLWLPAAAVALLAIANITLAGIWPGLVQRFTVQPNQLNKERPYIQHHIEFTRRAHGIDRVQPQTFPLSGRLTAQAVEAEQPTLRNVRLWDWRLVGQNYQQLQGLRSYYDLSGVDIDRYPLNGREQQVMLAARELRKDRLPPQSQAWVSQTLQYTHGYGFVMNAVNVADENGNPVFLASGLPLSAPKDLPVTTPQIYYGEQTVDAVLAPSKQQEFSYSVEGETAQGESATHRFAGTGGIPLGGQMRQFLLSLYLKETNVLISDQVGPDTRVLMHRKIDERAAKIAPFLGYDHDPYLVLADGKLYWMQDAYTLAHSDQFPYSQPVSSGRILLSRLAGFRQRPGERFGYIRNSVKVVTDAYSGQTTFYAVDEADPLLRCYRAMFPRMFKARAEMPDSLWQHVRYPEDLFEIQTGIMQRFHVTDPNVFYQGSDFWQLPQEQLTQDTEAERSLTGRPGEGSPMEAYYVTMRLPGAEQEEFALIRPFTFQSRPNLSAWMAARCDPEHYGELVLFGFPSTQVRGPAQVEQAINTNTELSAEISLLNRGGSRVIWGNMLILPVGNTLLYVRPMYLIGQGENQIPTFNRAVLYGNGTVVWNRSLSGALSQLVGAPVRDTDTGTPAPPDTGTTPPTQPGRPTQGITVPPEARQLISEADQALQAAERAQREGNWAEYGRQQQRLRAALQRLRQQVAP